MASKVLRVDEPMAERAVSTGARIGVIATLPSTLEPTAALIKSRAAAAGKQIELTTRVSGNGAKHDELVAAALREMTKSVDVIVLAQASMARVVESLPPTEKRVPILSSPRSAIEHLASLIEQ